MCTDIQPFIASGMGKLLSNYLKKQDALFPPTGPDEFFFLGDIHQNPIIPAKTRIQKGCPSLDSPITILR